MRYYLIAGEASGDLHASNLMRSLLQADATAEFRYFGGDKMQAVGGTLVRHYKDTAIMGFVRVITHLPTILSSMKQCEEDIAAYQPDAVILVDYPGFNLKIAKWVHQHLHLPIYYYIPPKIWAWKEGRVKWIQKYVDKVFAIFPFEVAFYAKHGIQAEYVGNPCVQTIVNRPCQKQTRAEFLQQYNLPDKPIIALLPGSRAQEVTDSLQTFSHINPAQLEKYQWVVAATNAVDPSLYQAYPQFTLVYNNPYALLQQAEAAVVNSGTATLETALIGTPQVVCYGFKASRLVYPIMEHLIKIPYVSLVNIIAEKTVVKELLGHYFTPISVEKELLRILQDEEYKKQMQTDYQAIAEKLGNSIASDKAAVAMVQDLENHKK